MALGSNHAMMILRGGSSILSVELFLASLAHFDLLCKELYKKGLLFVSRIGECVSGITEGGSGKTRNNRNSSFSYFYDKESNPSRCGRTCVPALICPMLSCLWSYSSLVLP